jgi:hypothetical protein
MSQPDEGPAQELARARQQWEDLAKAHQWASDLTDEESQDRTLILEGLLEIIVDITDGKPVDFGHYTRMYTH